MAVKNYVATNFRLDFEPSSNSKGKLAFIYCELIDVSDCTWKVKIEQYQGEEEPFSLYEKAEAIRDVFVQEYHEVKRVYYNSGDQAFVINAKETVEEVLTQIAKQI